MREEPTLKAGHPADAGDRPTTRPVPGTAVVTGKGLSGEDTEAFFAGPGLGLILIRPARKYETTPQRPASPMTAAP